MATAVKSYTTQQLVQASLKRVLTDDELVMFDVLADGVKQWIDRYTSSNFSEEETETSRYYDGGGSSLDIDPVQSISAISYIDNEGDIVEAYVEDTDYTTEPQNTAVKREVVRRYGCFPSGQRRIKVTGKFTEYDYVNNHVPGDIRMVATQLVCAALKTMSNAESGNIASEALEGHSVTYNTTNTFEDAFSKNPVLQGILDQRKDIFI